jgi:hypothetical protein
MSRVASKVDPARRHPHALQSPSNLASEFAPRSCDNRVAVLLCHCENAPTSPSCVRFLPQPVSRSAEKMAVGDTSDVFLLLSCPNDFPEALRPLPPCPVSLPDLQSESASENQHSAVIFLESRGNCNERASIEIRGTLNGNYKY